MAQVITGAKALIKLSGGVVAFATGVSVTHEDKLEEIPQLDQLEVAEYAENGHRCTIVINTIKLASDANFGGIKLSNNGADFNLDFPVGDVRGKLLQPEMIIEIVDQVPVRDGNGFIVNYEEVPVYRGFGAKFESGSGQLEARGIWQGSWTFRCRRGVGI